MFIIHDEFASIMRKIDSYLGNPIQEWENAPKWLEYSRLERTGKDLIKVRYRMGVLVDADWIE